MSDGPRRLKDDPAFIRATGVDVGAEADLLYRHDHDGLKGRLLAAVAAGVLPSVAMAGAGAYGLKTVLLASVVSAVLGGAGTALIVVPALERAAQPPADAPVVVEVAREIDAGPAGEPVEPAEPAEPAEAPARAPRRPDRSKKAAPAPEAPLGGDLAEQLRVYERAEEALHAGRHDVAVRELRSYLKRWPRGDFRLEAELSWLDALARSGKHAEAEAKARRLLRDRELAGRRPELLRVQAGALAHLGRCDEARKVAAAARKAGAPVGELAVVEARCADAVDGADSAR